MAVPGGPKLAHENKARFGSGSELEPAGGE